ncbi:MAG TPA: hypothetical protein PKD53_19470 [Chloroflexaceae bacterium]|nr:hypothetical protein [Chloroflexaceae bacterium]
MRLYVLYAILVASVVIASVAVTPGLSERLRRWLIVAVAALVIAPGALYLIFGGG